MDNNERVREQFIKDSYKAGIILERSFLRKTNGNIILDNLLKNNEKLPECVFNQRESLELILKNKRYDLLGNVTIKNLLRKKNERQTFLDYILELSKKDKSVNISLFDPFNTTSSLKDIALFYITYAKYGMLDYLPPLTDNELKKKESNPIIKLLNRNRNFLDILLKKKSYDDLVKSKLISDSKIKDLDLILTLKDSKEYKAPLDIQDNYSKEYIEEENSWIESIAISLNEEENDLLDELYDVMSDRCDDDAINTAIYSYMEQFYYGDKASAYNEIRQLIEIFKNDKTFKIKMAPASCFSSMDNTLYLSSMSTKVFNHELGHMLYHKLTAHENDKEFFEIINRIKNDPKTIDKVDNLSKRYDKIKPAIKKKAIDYYKNLYNDENTLEHDKKIEKNLNRRKEELIKEYKILGYSNTVIENILNRTYNLEEYKRQHKIIQINSLMDSIRKEKISPILQISDIIDAIYRGEFMDDRLYNSNKELIKPISGHGIYYYNSREESIFDEIFANYCALRKNNENGISFYEDPVKGKINNPISCLREIVGDELVNYLENFYQNKILNNNISRRI